MTEKMKRILVCVVFVAVYAGRGVLQCAPSRDVVANPEMARLARLFAGKWRTHEVFTVNSYYPKGAERTGLAEFHLATGGTALIENVSSNGSAGKLDFMVVLWWDADEHLYRMFTCGNAGTSPCRMRGVARWQDEKLINEYDLTVNGVSHKALDSFEQISPRSFTLVASADLSSGGMSPIITTTYTRE